MLFIKLFENQKKKNRKGGMNKCYTGSHLALSQKQGNRAGSIWRVEIHLFFSACVECPYGYIIRPRNPVVVNRCATTNPP